MGDNAESVQAAFRIVKEDEHYSHVQPLGCMPHILHLIVGDILKFPKISNFFKEEAQELVNTGVNSQRLNSTFTAIKREKMQSFSNFTRTDMVRLSFVLPTKFDEM